MGDDGHTASWFPHAPGLAEAIDPAARALVAAMPAPDGLEPRLTLTGRALLRARALALQIEGPAKAATFARAQAGRPRRGHADPRGAARRGRPADGVRERGVRLAPKLARRRARS